ncbi:DUF3106 domain-containing protein [Pandoraea pulmonicola]|uniref:Protein of uncharacterized function (DUF3106) n=1 Tax=Pandoraea pulmonicola TaxID=93221 RepID=A0AAJ4ZGS3_PANPU|nr:DUF3106 domain-containing protein [Pandoraea pulmonicola]APD13535.1 hypothetical protein RO07_25495 [Pandoraea pulmonicola]SUA93039.1 Protein of uncharacterised function (DUF3106) [Pandoraea pulmonicola]
MTRRNVLFLVAALIVAGLAGTAALRRAQTPAPVSDAPPTIGASASGAAPTNAPVGSLSASAPQAGSAAPAAALPSPGGYWAKLSPAQQEALAPLAQDWNRMGERQREKWIEIAKRFHALSPEGRKRLHDRMADWVRLTPEQRKLARESYQNARALPPERKAQVWQQYQQLTEEQKSRLAADDKKQANRPNVVSAPPSGRTGVKNPYAVVHRKDAAAAGRNGALPAPATAPASTASAPVAALPAPASTAPSTAASSASASAAGASAANADKNGDAVFNSDLYHHN